MESLESLTGELIMARAACFMVTAFIEIAIFLGLAIYVVARNPRRPINWVFGAFCFTVINHYLSSLFLFPEPELPPPVTFFLLRWKWVTHSFSPTFYLHLVSFYFSPAWRRYRRWALLPAYLFSAGLAMAALFTDLLVAGPLHRLPPYIIGPVPGPLMRLYVGLFALEVVIGIGGLIAGYRAALSPSLRRQIVYLLIPTGLLILGGVGTWIIILTKATGRIPFELMDMLVLLAAFFYARAVLLYGSFVGRPLAWRDLFYATLGIIAGLVTLYLTTTLDRWLAAYTPFPYPLATGILVVIVAVGFPTIGRWVTKRLDGLLFWAERQRRGRVYDLVEALAETSDPEELQAELLATLCAVLRVHGGYVALSDPDLPPETLTVRVVQGNLPLRPGDPVHLPPLHGKEPRLVAALLPHEQAEPAQQEIALLCPLPADQESGGVLALGKKQNGTLFTPQELALCADLTRQLGAIRRMIRLREQRNRHLEAARLRDQALRQLEEEIIASTHQTLAARRERHAAPLEIRLLGPLQVVRDGKLMLEAEWGTERAKALLAYLLWKGPAGATREEISMALWPGRPVEDTANVFHVTLYHLRRVLEPGLGQGDASSYILHERGRYRFNASAPHWLDVTVFRALVADSKPAALREAVALYRGPYLEDAAWTLPPEVEAQRRALELLYEDALRRLAAQTPSREAVLYLTKLLAVEPADDTAHRALVTSYLARGRRDLARRQVARWRQALDELDLEPSPEARALWRMVENGQGNPCEG
jgi:DNA-binding SARP family transcriptional activator